MLDWKAPILKDVRVQKALREANKEKSWSDKQAELLSMHSGRLSRGLFHNKNFLKATKISAAALQDSSFRSRAVDIIIEARVHHNILSAYIDRLSDHIKAEYSKDLKSFPTIAQRDSAVRTILDIMYEQLQTIDNLVESCEYVITDIDKMSWSLSKAVEALSIVVSKGHEL